MDAIEQIEGMKIKELFTELKKVKLEKDDVLIFSIKEAMTDEHYEGMRAELDVIFPNNKKNNTRRRYKITSSSY